MNDNCETCSTCGAGTTPLPGQNALGVRLGTQADFIAAMKARLSQAKLDGVDLSAINGLTTRALTDPAVAWLDAGALVADILTFYQERIANEGYLRTATEVRSVTELARLVGYAPRPGVSASCHLAYTLETGSDTVIPMGTRAASTPAQGQLPQVFETEQPLDAHADWNALSPRLSRPQVILSADARNIVPIYLDGDATNVKPGDLLLLAFPDGNPQPRRVEKVDVDHIARRTTVHLQVDALSALKTILDVRQALVKHQGETSLAAVQSPPTDVQDLLTANKNMCQSITDATKDRTALADVDEKLTDALPSIDNVQAQATKLKKQYGDGAALVDTLLNDVKAARKEPMAVRQMLAQFAVLNTWYTQQDTLLAALQTELTKPTPPASGPAADLTNAAQSAVTTLAKLIALNSSAANQASPKELTDATAKLNTDLGNLVSTPLPSQAAKDAFVVAFDAAKVAFTGGQFWEPTAATNTAAVLTTLNGNLNPATTLKANALVLDGGLTALDTVIAGNPATQLGVLTRLKQLKVNLSQTDGVRAAVTASNQRFTNGLPTDKTPLLTAVIPLVNNLPTQLQSVTTVTDAVKAFGDFQKALQDARAADQSDAIAKGADLLQKSAVALLSVLTGSLWSARQEFLREFTQAQTRFLRLKNVQPLPDPVALTAITAVVQLGSDLNTLLPTGAPVTDQFPKSKLVVLLETIINVVDPLQAHAAQMREDAQQFFATLALDLKTTRVQITGQPSAAGGTGSTPSNELAGLFDVSGKLTVAQRTTAGRPAPNPDLILGVPDVNSPQGSQAAVDAIPRFLQSINPDQTAALFNAWRGNRYGNNELQVFAFRQKTQLFGYNAPQFLPTVDATKPLQPNSKLWPDESPSRLYLSEGYDGVLPGSYVVVESISGDPPQPYLVGKVAVHPRTAYGLSTKTTEIDLDQALTWRSSVPADSADLFNLLRTTTVYAQSDKLELAEVPIGQNVGSTPNPDDPDQFLSQPGEIELDDLYDGIDIGRTVIVAGELADLPGVRLAEPASVASVTHIRRAVFGDTPHTTVGFAQDLTNVYKRETLVVYGNVVPASHGETHREVLGSGDGTPYQQFTLKFSPLTHLPAPTPDGAEPFLEVRINDVLWTRGRELSDFGPGDRSYAIRINDDQTATVIFGNGINGACPPTGVDNIRTVYRSGLGAGGNLAARQIDQARDRPLGVKAVINPFPSSGGADRETRDQVRANAPIGSKALERVVSVGDFADFARTFAGIGKATVARMPGACRSLVHVTISGLDPTPVREDSDLFRNLLQAFNVEGDGTEAVVLQPCRRVLLIVIAAVRVAADYLFESVEPRVRQLLLDRFGYVNRDLTQGITASEILTAIHGIEGVAYADLTALGAISEFSSSAGISSQLQAVTDQLKAGHPSLRWVTAAPAIYRPGNTPPYEAAELAYLDAGLPETLLLSEVQP